MTTFLLFNKFNVLLILMTKRIINFLEAFAPLANSSIDLEDVMIVSFLESHWSKEKKVQVNDIIEGISNISSSTIHRRLRRMRMSHILKYSSTDNDWRVRYVQKGKNYDAHLKVIAKLYDGAQLQKL